MYYAMVLAAEEGELNTSHGDVDMHYGFSVLNKSIPGLYSQQEVHCF